MHLSLDTLFAATGLKMTEARYSIMHVLSEAKAPMNYEQIKQRMQHDTDKATFYRNVAKFIDLGLVHKFESDDRKWYFELISSPHAHFICESCHQITCMEMDFRGIEGDVKSIVLKGTCKECLE